MIVAFLNPTPVLSFIIAGFSVILFVLLASVTLAAVVFMLLGVYRTFFG
jgi:hypothetical protein